MPTEHAVLQSGESAARSADELRRRLRDEVRKIVVGADEATDDILIALLSRGHILFEGVPGIAKTTLAKAAGTAIGCNFRRIQFTPDVLPSDVTGTFILDKSRQDFVLRKGPIFTNILLVDEINRAPAKTQSALLEAMQENQVTIDGETFALPSPFLVMATQNPIELEGVYRLPEAELDRFFLRILFRYPTADEEKSILALHSRATEPIRPLLDPDAIRAWQGAVEGLHVPSNVLDYVVAIAEKTRAHPDLFLGASPRASLFLLQAARSRAFLHDRPYATHDDVKSMAPKVLAHRLVGRPESEMEGRTASSVLERILAEVPVFGT